MLTPCQLVGHVHEDRGEGRDPGRVAGRGDVPGGPERDRKNLGGSDEPPRDGLRNRLAHWDALLSVPLARVRETLAGPWAGRNFGEGREATPGWLDLHRAGPHTRCAHHPNR